MTPAQLKAIMPRCPADKLDTYCAALNDAMAKASATTPERQAALLGQVAWESGDLRYNREEWTNSDQQARYERDAIAAWPPTKDDRRNSLAFDLGNYAPGDGYAFRGWGALQNTGRGNTAKASNFIYGDDRLVQQPALLDDPAVGLVAIAWYWSENGINVHADAWDLRAVTKAVNGAATDEAPSYYLKREAITQHALEVLKAA